MGKKWARSMSQVRLAALFLSLTLCSLSAWPQTRPQTLTPSEQTLASTTTTPPQTSSSIPYSAPSAPPDGSGRGQLHAIPYEPGTGRVLRSKDNLHVHPFSKVAIGIKVSALGPAIDIATPLSRSFNLRGTGNFFDYGYNFNIDGVNYNTELHFHSGQLGLDWFPFHGGFHITPGVIYFQNALSGIANVPPGQTFTLSDTTYTNSIDDPVSGTAAINYSRHIAPTLAVGFGNIIPRSGKHFTVPVEFGAAYLGAARMDIKLAGTACTPQGCFNAATDPDTQKNLQSEVKDLNDQVAKFKFYPILSVGVAYRF